MPTIFSHSVAALAIQRIFSSGRGTFKIYLLVVICSVIPDADVIAFKFGIPYGDILGHRGFSHSILFAALWALFIRFFFFIKNPTFSKEGFILFLLFFFSTLSHGILDAFTNGGLGVCFYCPFDSTRYFFPHRPILVSPIGKRFFSDWGMRVLISEFFIIWIPSLFIILAAEIVRRRSGK